MKYVLLSFFITFAIFDSFAQTAEEYLEMGKAAAAEEKFVKSEEYARASMDLEPSPEGYLWLSISLVSQGKVKESFRALEDRVEEYPKASILYARQGLFYTGIRQYNASIRCYTKAIEFAQDDSAKHEYLNDRGWSKSLLQDYENAYSDVRKAYNYDTTNLGFLHNLGMIVEGLGYPDSSIYFLTKCLKYDSTNVAIYSNIGFTYQKMEKYKESIPYFEKASELSPKEGVVYNNLGFSKFMAGEVKSGLRDVNKAIKLDSYNPYAYRNRGIIYIDLGKTSKACEDFAKAIQLGYTRSYGTDVKELQEKHCK